MENKNCNPMYKLVNDINKKDERKIRMEVNIKKKKGARSNGLRKRIREPQRISGRRGKQNHKGNHASTDGRTAGSNDGVSLARGG